MHTSNSMLVSYTGRRVTSRKFPVAAGVNVSRAGGWGWGRGLGGVDRAPGGIKQNGDLLSTLTLLDNLSTN